MSPISHENTGRAQPAPRVYRVAEITRRIKTLLEDEIGEIWVQGEIANLRRPASGHVYFTLKDAASQLKAVLFRGDCRGMAVEPADGLLVRIFGRITVYEAGGQYQILARRMEPLGAGALQAAFEALKRKLLEEGLFESERKKPLPMLPQRIGLVTSPTGAVIRDLLSVLLRRFPNLHVTLAPTRVQGAEAPAEIAAALDLFNQRGGFDVLVVARGGGGIEDLWAFNEEIVARAIARSRIPVVSAVGHETDFTISDFVADLRAPTPSAAAELIVGRKVDFERQLSETAGRLTRALRGRAAEMRGRFAAAAAAHVFRAPGHLARQMRERLARHSIQLGRSLESRFRQDRQLLDEQEIRLTRCIREKHERRSQDIRRFETQLMALSPLAVLARGYSITTCADGRVLTRSSGIKPGDRLLTRLSKGTITSNAVEIS